MKTSFHSVLTSSLDAAVQTSPQSTLSQDVSAQMGSCSPSSFSFDIFVQTPIRSNGVTRSCHTTTDHGVLYWMYLLERSPGPPKLRSSAPAISTRSTCLAAAAAGTRTAQPRLQILLLTLTCYTSHGASTISCTSTSPATFSYFSHAPTAACSVPPMGDHTLYDQLLPPKEVLVPPLREPTILLLLILVQEQVVFLHRAGPGPSHWFKFGQSKSDRAQWSH